ncbi:MAG: hypothetical protein LRS48_03545 [Desulfurococcales archaeon]|nr:hypothetical protein [Desulfurococcales archaeon]
MPGARLRRIPGRVGERLSFLGSMLDPVRALVNPLRYYSRLRRLLARYGLYGVAVVYFASWIGTSILTFIIILLIEFIRNAASLNITGIMTAPLRAAVYSFIFPVIAAFLDAIIILILLAPFPRERPLYDVFAVRASSLLPYGLRIVLLEATGRLSLKSLLAATGSPVGLILLLLGTALTITGLKRTMKTTPGAAIIAGSGPLIYKLALAYL